MEDEEQKICPNCKREIPAVNFTIHTVHCARNIKVCPVCKEPVPHADLEEHHEKLHKLLPCKQCGEKVCGTDLEDHIRDSCGHTTKSCRFCELELPRRDIPGHENYCGVRTEQCPDCREWVMIKYRQLHLDSNHGFLRLDDGNYHQPNILTLDPVPQPKKEPQKTTNLPKMTNLPKLSNLPRPSTSNGFVQPTTSFTKNTNIAQDRPRTEIRYLGSSNSGPSTSKSSGSSSSSLSNVIENSLANLTRAQSQLNGISKVKRTNDQPQINTAVAAPNKVEKQALSRGAVKKRPAPQPPAVRARQPPNNDPKREMAYKSALQRSQEEERKRQEQNAYNLAHGLPPVLSAAAKLEKLRKMDALQNREVEDQEYKNRLQGRVWMDRTSVPAGNVLGSDSSSSTDLEVDRRRNRGQNRPNSGTDVRREDFSDVKPMSPQEFMDRFKELQLRKEEAPARSEDRFSEIKSSLRELRRGLNEVTAPYNSSNPSNGNKSERNRRRSPRLSRVEQNNQPVYLPCEFCGTLVPEHDLVRHQTGCRPDLAQYRPGSYSPFSPRSPSSLSPRSPSPQWPEEGRGQSNTGHDHHEPVIPCEFCTQPMPVYLISEHQERCGRDTNFLYPD